MYDRTHFTFVGACRHDFVACDMSPGGSSLPEARSGSKPSTNRSESSGHLMFDILTLLRPNFRCRISRYAMKRPLKGVRNLRPCCQFSQRIPRFGRELFREVDRRRTRTGTGEQRCNEQAVARIRTVGNPTTRQHLRRIGSVAPHAPR